MKLTSLRLWKMYMGFYFNSVRLNLSIFCHSKTETMRQILIISLLFWGLQTSGQQTIGLFKNSQESFPGYTIFAPIKSKTTYLINNCGEQVHSWTSNYQPNLSCYLLNDGSLLRTGRIPVLNGGGGVIELISWDNKILWSYSLDTSIGWMHHDIELLPNGNILMIANDNRSQTEVSNAGSITTQAILKSEQIIEIKPDYQNGGGSIVWTWKAWDHLIQDHYPTRANYGIVANEPDKIDINYLNHGTADWLHFNGIDYNAEWDQIMISVHNMSEFWIIDHSTTTAEASSSSGGNYNKGGDLLYRWGNPAAYQQGNSSNQKLFMQHHAHWIPKGLQNEGNILVFNNEAGSTESKKFSTVNSLELPVDLNGNYSYYSGSYGPADFNWTYKAQPDTQFYSAIISSAQRLPNGNTLICEGNSGRFFEVDNAGNTVWEYINPVNDMGPQAQGQAIQNNMTFRCERFALDHTAFQGKNLTPSGHIESGSTFSCKLYTGMNSILASNTFNIFPNPASRSIHIDAAYSGEVSISVFSSDGQFLSCQQFNGSQFELDCSAYPNGLYFIRIQSGSSEIFQSKVQVLH
ncbi:MAG: T9SS type A sorting domain-containing protein [Bacteroidetes bacterium]|nr:T9SS type A sorting domain-containing protein [Bacteroidota bacterium]